MVFKTREQFISKHGTRRYGLVEYILRMSNRGLDDLEIQAELLKSRVVKSPQMLNLDWKYWNSVKDKVKWNT